MDETNKINDLIIQIDETIISLLKSREKLVEEMKKSNIKITDKEFNIVDKLKNLKLNKKTVDVLLDLLKKQ